MPIESEQIKSKMESVAIDTNVTALYTYHLNEKSKHTFVQKIFITQF